MKSVAFHNLGCKVNSYELDVMQQKLLEKGYKIVPFSQKADIYVINTCTVTNMADRKSRQMLHRAKQKNPSAIVVAVGCYVQTRQESAAADPCVDLCIGNNKKSELDKILEEYLESREAGRTVSGAQEAPVSGTQTGGEAQEAFWEKTLGGRTVIDIAHTAVYEEAQLKTTAEHTRAYIKIQDGCNQFCSYCAIPLARGRVRSRRAEEIDAEIRRMVQAGYREIVLTGIHISSYGIDFEEEPWERGESVVRQRDTGRRDYFGSSKLLDLLERIHDIEGLERIRLGSLEPRIVTRESARRLAGLSKVCPHFHLSLQSGCDATLQRMNRHYTTEEFRDGVKALREAFVSPAITTDVIVGFPGETPEEFAQTKAFLEEIRFYELHVFPYSRRAGTKAAQMPGQVPEQTKSLRSRELLRLDAEISVKYRERYLGNQAQVLWEEEKQIEGRRYLLGHTRDYVKVAYLLSCEERQAQTSAEDGMPQKGAISMVTVQGFLTEEILIGDTDKA